MPQKTAAGDIGWLPIVNLTQRVVKKEMAAKQIHLYM